MADEIVERWLPVPGYEGLYSVSDLGRVRSEPRITIRQNGDTMRVFGRVLRPTVLPSGYIQADLRNGPGRHTHFYVHRLVLEAFIGPAPQGTEACHNNGQRADNRACNLRWDTRRSNHADKLQHGTSLRNGNHPTAKLTPDDVRAIRADTRSAQEIAAQFGVTDFHVYHVKSGRAWRYL